jgi:hypothetical protein
VVIGGADSVTVAPRLYAGISPEGALDQATGHQMERGLILRNRGNERNLFLLTSCSGGSSRGGVTAGFSSSSSTVETRSCGSRRTFRSSKTTAGLPPCAQGLVRWGWDLMRRRDEMGHRSGLLQLIEEIWGRGGPIYRTGTIYSYRSWTTTRSCYGLNFNQRFS